MAIERNRVNETPEPKMGKFGRGFGPVGEGYWANLKGSLERMIVGEVGEKNRLVRVNHKLRGYVEKQSLMIGKILERGRGKGGGGGKKAGVFEGGADGGWGVGKSAAKPKVLGRKSGSQSFYLSPTGKNGIFDNEILRDKVTGPRGL